MIALCLLLSSLSAPARAAQDRYGPPRAPDVESARVATPQRLLSWTGKSAQSDYNGGRLPAPVAPWTERRSATPGPAVAALPSPPDRPRPAPVRAGDMPAPVAPWTDRAANGPVQSTQGALPPPVSPWTDRPSAQRIGQGEALILDKLPSSNSPSKTPANNDDIPVTQTKQNAAATRNSPIDF